MIDIQGIVLHKILKKDEGYLDAWSKIKLGYFDAAYSPIYRAVSKHYINHQDLPTFSDLSLLVRNKTLKISLEALQEVEVPDVDLDIAVDALVDKYTQEQTLEYIDSFIDEITYLDSEEIKEKLGNILLDLEEKTLSSEEIVTMADIEFIQDQEELQLMPLGLNNTFDAEVGGMSPTEVLAIGGLRGTGKSNVCTNLCVNQYEMGKSALYFSIEMRAREVFNRTMALLSDVPLGNISKASLTELELRKIAEARADMFEDSEDLLLAFHEHGDYPRFERELISTKTLKDNQIIIIDNQKLTLANIDLTIQKFKAKFGDSLQLVVIDYLNQIDIEDKYEWKNQIAISAKLKELARKYNVILVTPYQIDKTGEARFSKGILDSVDIAMILERSEGRIDFKSTKTRNMKKFEFASPMNELTMRIDPNDSALPPKDDGNAEEEKKDTYVPKKQETEEGDIPPWM